MDLRINTSELDQLIKRNQSSRIKKDKIHTFIFLHFLHSKFMCICHKFSCIFRQYFFLWSHRKYTNKKLLSDIFFLHIQKKIDEVPLFRPCSFCRSTFSARIFQVKQFKTFLRAVENINYRISCAHLNLFANES